MALYEFTKDSLTNIPIATYSSLKLRVPDGHGLVYEALT
jgi:hypothetical protein